MKTTTKYLDEAKKALGIDSDNAMAKYLGVTRGAISNYRNGVSVMDDYAAAKIAGALGIEAMFVIAAANAEREKTVERKDYWKNFYERLGGVAASVLLGVLINVTFIMTPSPVQANEIGHVNTPQCILCKIELMNRLYHFIKKQTKAAYASIQRLYTFSRHGCCAG